MGNMNEKKRHYFFELFVVILYSDYAISIQNRQNWKTAIFVVYFQKYLSYIDVKYLILKLVTYRFEV